MTQGKPLTAAMDNSVAMTLGQICVEAAEDKAAGDLIDRGLILRRMLEEHGFLLVESNDKSR